MHLVEVIPIARGISTEVLSYFTGKPISAGEIVKVPVRTRIIPAMVVAVRSASELKADIRKAPFEIKKLEEIVAKRVFRKEFVETAAVCAEYFATTTGAVLASLLPKALLTSLPELPELGESLKHRQQFTPERIILQAPLSERLSHYKSLIREEFARGRSVAIVVPTIQDGTVLESELSRGIEAFTYFFHTDVPRKKILERWRQLAEDPHPILTIMTGSFLGLPRNDLGVLVVERESARGYKLQFRPYLDIRVFAERYAGALGARFILADMPLRVETLGRMVGGEVEEFGKLRARAVSSATSSVIDARRPTEAKKKAFETLTPELREALGKILTEGKRAFLFTVRRGLSPVTACGDCESIVTCSVCDAAVVLHRAGKENAFVCHSCGAVRSAHEKCKTCDSWKLVTLGIGIERVREELSSLFPDVPLFVLERETAKNHKEAVAIAKKFYSTAPAILLGTELSFPYVEKEVALSAIVSADTLLSVPEWRTQERLFSALLAVRGFAREHFFIQTREPEQPTIALARDGNIIEFYKAELARRSEFRYPPATVLIKLTIEGTRSRIAAGIETLTKEFGPYGFLVYAPSVHLGHGNYLAHGLLRITKAAWPDAAIVRKLRALSPEFAIDVEPQNLLSAS